MMHENRIYLENPWQREIEYREPFVEQDINLHSSSQVNGQSEMNNQIRNLVENFLNSCD